MRLPDLTLAVRHLIRRPGFAAAAILLLALGAGANAAVFSVVRGVLLQPLPYQAPEQLVALWPEGFVNNEDLTYWRERTRSFQAIGADSDPVYGDIKSIRYMTAVILSPGPDIDDDGPFF